MLLYKIQAFKVWGTLKLTFQGDPRSNVMVSLDSPYITPYWCDIVTKCLSLFSCYRHLKNASPMSYACYHWVKILGPPIPTLPKVSFSKATGSFHPWVVGRLPPDMKLIGSILLWYILLTDIQTDTQMQSKKFCIAELRWGSTGCSNDTTPLIKWYKAGLVPNVKTTDIKIVQLEWKSSAGKT